MRVMLRRSPKYTADVGTHKVFVYLGDRYVVGRFSEIMTRISKFELITYATSDIAPRLFT